MSKSKAASRGKKGLTQSQAVGLVAALALGILLLQFSKPFISAVQAQDIIEGCKLSVALSSWQLQKDLWVMDYTFLDSPFRFNCKTIFTEITKESINRADDKIKLSDDSNLAKEQLKEAIMRNMRECWYMFGAGNIKVQQAVDTKGTACIVCSEIIATKEFIDDAPAAVKQLDNMYTYAATATIPPKDEQSYLDYFLAGTTSPVVNLADLDKEKEKDVDTKIILNKQYSVVFAITAMEERPGALFGKGGTIEANAGILDCYVNEKGTTKKATGDDAVAIGCNKNNDDPMKGVPKEENPGLIFGKVIDGGTKVDLLDWQNFVSVTGAPLRPKLRTYPATVRLVPTSQLANSCKRLY